MGLVVGIILISGCIGQEIPRDSDVQQKAPTKTPDSDFSQNVIQFTDMGEKLLCISHPSIRNKEFIINSNEDYNKLLDYKSPTNNDGDWCFDFKSPSIDFSQYTLIGKWAEGGGCSINFTRKFYKDDSSKKIIYSIKVVEEGNCTMMGTSMNWALIPKIATGYSVEFQVK